MASLTDDFVREIQRRILTGTWEIGMRLPSSRLLAEEFHVSRSVINAGIAQLCADGYLLTSPRQWVQVSNWKSTGNFALLSGIVDHGLCDSATLENFLEGRMTIEKAIARRAARARTEEDICSLRSILERERADSRAEERTAADIAFHHALAQASHNIVYAAMLNSFTAVEEQLVRQFYAKDFDRSFVDHIHEQICRAVENRDADEAEKLMEKLLAHGEKMLKK